MWSSVLVASLGCYAEKLAGYLLPERVLDRRIVHHVSALLPVALLAGIVTVQATTAKHAIVLDARAPGMVVAIALMARRTNFLVMVVSAAATTALVRHLGWMP
jgi:hypothetical protein